MRPFNKGLKTLITAFLVVMFAVAFLTPAVSASQWDPKSPPVYPWLDGKARTPEYDDHPWVEQNRSSWNNYDDSAFYSLDYWFGAFLKTIGISFIIVEGSVPVENPNTNTDIQSGANNGSN